MRFDQAIRTVFLKYADFTGRAARPEFWWWVLFTTLVNAALNTLQAILVHPLLAWTGTVGWPAVMPAVGGSGLSGLWSIAVLLPTLAVTVRRLRDAGRHWGNVFWILLPLAGLIVLIVLCAQPSVPPERPFDTEAAQPVIPASKP
jgi:uncharacterized membrane protein YhaH (DUF805 family)